ncbi:MAG: hypothetical protein EOP09_02995 [Proteobacteria bacterium]|nr:MAG: hypothetical protein EOP09_02995 [Pseudomonadota bacterium]
MIKAISFIVGLTSAVNVLLIHKSVAAPITSLTELERSLQSKRITSVEDFAVKLGNSAEKIPTIFIKNSRSLQRSSPDHPRIILGLGQISDPFQMIVTVGSPHDPSSRGQALEGLRVDTSRPERPIQFFTVEFPEERRGRAKPYRIDSSSDTQTLCLACHRGGYIWNSPRFWPGAGIEINDESMTQTEPTTYFDRLKQSLSNDSTVTAAPNRYTALMKLWEHSRTTVPAETTLAIAATDQAIRRLAVDIQQNKREFKRYRSALIASLLDCDLQNFNRPPLEWTESDFAEMKTSIDRQIDQQLSRELATSHFFQDRAVTELARSSLRNLFYSPDRSHSSRLAKFQWVLNQFTSIELKHYSIDFLRATYEIWNDDSGHLDLARLLNENSAAMPDCAQLTARSTAQSTAQSTAE